MNNKLYVGIDLGTRASTVCVMNEQKEIIKTWEGNNNKMPEFLTKYKGDTLCVVESAPLAESVCNMVEDLGMKAEVIDSRHTKMALNGKKKTDKVDAKVLAELAVMGWYKPIHRKSGKDRDMRTYLVARDQIVRSTTALKNGIRGMLKAHGVVLEKSIDGNEFSKRVKESVVILPEISRTGIISLLEAWEKLHGEKNAMYKRLSKIAKKDKVSELLMTVPGVGPATALCYSSTISKSSRFKDKKQVASYVGLAPRVYQSGDTNYHGSITKQGDRLMRSLLVEAAHSILCTVKKDFTLKQWGMKLKEKKGMGKAKIAVARKLSELLFTLWERQQKFNFA